MAAELAKPSRLVGAAVVAGCLAGIVDVGAAALINRISPLLILQAISSGLLGLSAYHARWTIALGLVLQIVMSVVIAGIYAVAAMRLPALRRHPYPAGLAYGVGVFLVMNLVVVPLSAFAPKQPHPTLIWLALNLAAMLLFGILVATSVSRTLGRGSQ